MTPEDRAANFRERMRADMSNTLHQTGGDVLGEVEREQIIDALVDDGMFHVEHLLVEVDNLTTENSLLREGTA